MNWEEYERTGIELTPEQAIYQLKLLLGESEETCYIDTGDVIEIVNAVRLTGKVRAHCPLSTRELYFLGG